jgi:hypothetical protein
MTLAYTADFVIAILAGTVSDYTHCVEVAIGERISACMPEHGEARTSTTSAEGIFA